jgi:hypothetical protein
MYELLDKSTQNNHHKDSTSFLNLCINKIGISTVTENKQPNKI